MHIEENSFSVKGLKASFNKKANINKIYEKIQKKYSLREVTIYAFVGYYKFKKNTLLICFSNQKIFIDDEKGKVSFSGVYTYKNILEIRYTSHPKNDLKSYVELITENYNSFKIKGVSEEEFRRIKEVFSRQKEIYLKSFLEKINADEKNYDLIDENFSYSVVSNFVRKNEGFSNKNDLDIENNLSRVHISEPTRRS